MAMAFDCSTSVQATVIRQTANGWTINHWLGFFCGAALLGRSTQRKRGFRPTLARHKWLDYGGVPQQSEPLLLTMSHGKGILPSFSTMNSNPPRLRA